MATPLKDQNTLRLTAVALANMAVYFMILSADALSAADFQRLAEQIDELFPPALTIALMTVANGLIDAQTKARLVFWRWSNPLPGSRAFSVHARQDPRVDIGSLERKLGRFPEDEREQNVTWYRLYRSVASDPSVSHNHRDFLFARDYAALAVLFLFALGGLAIYEIYDWAQTLPYIGFLLVQYLAVRHVAVRYGNRFVATVLAVKATED